MDKSSQSISNTVLAVKVRGLICVTAPVPHGAALRAKLCWVSYEAAVLQYCIFQIWTAGGPSWSWCSYSREVSSLHPCVRHQLYLKRAVLAGDGGCSGVAGGPLGTGRLCLCPECKWLFFPVWSSLLQSTTKSVHKETHPKIQNWSLAQLLHFY